MRVVDLPIGQLREAPWNPNRMDGSMLQRLKASLRRFGLVENLVVWPLGASTYEVLAGNQRLQMLREIGVEVVPCVVVELDDAQARLLAQALNHIQGEDDLGLRAELVRELLKALPQEEVQALLPETAEGLQALAALDQQELAEHLRAWQQAQATRLKHLQFQLTAAQLGVVEKALTRVLARAKQEMGESPNLRGTALYLLCKTYLEREARP